MPTTEIAIFPFKSGAEPGDPDNAAAGVVKTTFDTLRQQDGVQQIHFGMQVETPSAFQLLVDWDHFDQHKAFMASSTYGPFLNHFLTLVDGQPDMHHVDFQPAGALNKVLAAPITELATFYFDGSPEAGYLQNVEKFRKIVEEKGVSGFLGLAVGITHEEIEREGVKGKAAVAALAWESVDHHLEFRQTELFKENIGLLRGTSKKIEMHHVAFMEAQA